MKYLLIFLISIISISLVVLLFIFLTSAAIYGSLFLPVVCLLSMVVFFFLLRLFNQKQEV